MFARESRATSVALDSLAILACGFLTADLLDLATLEGGRRS
jgi:hypothetical protein